MPGDSIFLRGTTHLVCEDYAMDHEGFAVVSDGCSSAPRSDVAARLVSLAARQAYREALPDPAVTGNQLRNLDQRAMKPLAALEELYATFLAARIFGSRVLVTAVGDGHLVLGHRDGTWDHYDFRYPLYNAPFYPAYALDLDAQRQWNQAFPGNTFRIKVTKKGQVSESASQDPWFTLEENTDDLSFLLLISDGLGSFIDSQGQPVEEATVLTELCAFKNRKGEFLKRRVLRMTEDFRNQRIHHQDDFSAAILTFE